MELAKLSLNCQHRNYTSLDQINWPNNGHEYDEFDCSYNELTSLAGLSNYLPNLKTIFFDNNKISNFEGLPQSLKYITCSVNLISNFDGLPHETRKLWIQNNKLTNLEGLDSAAPNLTLLDCDRNQITSLHGLPKLVSILRVDRNKITNFDGLTRDHQRLKIIECRHNKICSFKHLPINMTNLHCNNNNITSMDYFPSNVRYLAFENNPVYSKYMNSWTVDQIHNDVIDINVHKWIDGITLLRKLRLNYLLHSLWIQYWHHELDQDGFSRFIKYKAPKDYDNSGF